jgi:hypothetical protein
MTALPVTLIPTISKLIPRLASNHDGEVVATVRAIERVLKSAGHDLHDLAAYLRSPVAQIQDADWRRSIRFCFENADLLSERELNFITNIARRPRGPTVRQLEWLHNIVDRLRGAA